MRPVSCDYYQSNKATDVNTKCIVKVCIREVNFKDLDDTVLDN